MTYDHVPGPTAALPSDGRRVIVESACEATKLPHTVIQLSVFVMGGDVQRSASWLHAVVPPQISRAGAGALVVSGAMTPRTPMPRSRQNEYSVPGTSDAHSVVPMLAVMYPRLPVPTASPA